MSVVSLGSFGEFSRWMSEAAGEPGPARHALMAWVAHADESELPSILVVIRDREAEAHRAESEARARLSSERDRGEFGPADGSDFRGRVRYAILSHYVCVFADQARWLRRLALTIQGDRELHRQHVS